MLEQFDLFPVRKAREARDRAMKRVENNNQGWLGYALRYCESSLELRSIKEFSGEDLRVAIAPIVGQPRSPNAWGLVTRKLIEKGVIVPTGSYKHMRGEKAHARLTRCYRWAP